MNHHQGPSVIPGRYAGEAIAIHDGPTPDQLASAEQRARRPMLWRIAPMASNSPTSSNNLDGLQVLGALAVVVLLDDTWGCS